MVDDVCTVCFGKSNALINIQQSVIGSAHLQLIFLKSIMQAVKKIL